MRHVICFGNELHGDDGFGAAVHRRLAAMPLPADARLFEAGTRGLDALGLFEGCAEAILVDAAEPAGRRWQHSAMSTANHLIENVNFPKFGQILSFA